MDKFRLGLDMLGWTLDKFWQIWTSLDGFSKVWIRFGLTLSEWTEIGQVWARFEHVWTCMDKVWTSWDRVWMGLDEVLTSLVKFGGVWKSFELVWTDWIVGIWSGQKMDFGHLIIDKVWI